jgi:UDP-N-acetylglucosamine 2-epimerase
LGVASLIPLKYQKIREAVLREWDAKRMKVKTSPYGSGNSAGKILNVLEKHL